MQIIIKTKIHFYLVNLNENVIGKNGIHQKIYVIENSKRHIFLFWSFCILEKENKIY